MDEEEPESEPLWPGGYCGPDRNDAGWQALKA